MPIIVMTACSMQGDKNACLAAGMNDYISKPIKNEVVSQVVEKSVPANSATNETFACLHG